MNRKTKSVPKTGRGKAEFSPMFLRCLVVLTVTTLVVLFVSQSMIVWTHRYDDRTVEVLTLPWITAGGINVQQGLDMFRGIEPYRATVWEKISMLLGVLLGFVVGPTLLLFSWRNLTAHPQKSWLSLDNLWFFVGGAVTFLYFTGTLLAAAVHPQVAASMRKAQALSEHRDNVIADLSRISLDAVQYRILPKSLGGGGGSYRGYEVPSRLKKTAEGDYAGIEGTDTTIVVLATSITYPGAGIKAVFGKNGRLKGAFQFMGEFE